LQLHAKRPVPVIELRHPENFPALLGRRFQLANHLSSSLSEGNRRSTEIASSDD
jgi:hypothetical protein